MPTIWIARLFISERTAHKIISRHRLDPDDIRRQVECVAGLRFRWDLHPVRGRRAMILTAIGNRRVLVVLYPAGDPAEGEWHLGSAYDV